MERHRWVRRLTLVISLAVFGLLLAAVPARGPFAFDERVMGWAREAHGELLTALMVATTRLGDGEVLALLTVAGVALFFRRSWRWATFLAVATTGAGILNRALKLAIERARPSLFEPLAPAGGYAFPSGHAMGSAALFLALFFVVRAMAPQLQGIAAGLGMAVVAAVGVSRVYLGVHYPTDVVAGWAIGTAWVVLLQALAHRWIPRPVDGAPEDG